MIKGTELGWQVKIVEDPQRMQVHVHIFCVQNTGDIIYNVMGQKGQWEQYMLPKEGGIPEQGPTMTFPWHMWSWISKALVKELTEAGEKAPVIHRIEGELDATRKHLEDMRILVLGDKIKNEKP